MITDQEFSKLRTVIREEVQQVLDDQLEQKLEEKLESKLDQKLEEKLESKLDQKFKPIIKKLNKIEKDLKTTINFFDNEYLGHERRITKIESHLQFPELRGH